MSLRGALDDLLFAPAPAARLGIARALYCAGVLATTRKLDPAAWGEHLAALWDPITPWRQLGLTSPDPAVTAPLMVAFRASLVLGALGLATRASLALAAVLGGYLFMILNSYGKLSHTHHIVPLILGVLALARSGDAFSLDAVLARRRGAPPPADDGEYRWPLVGAQLVLALAFFAAGVAKLRYSPIEWLTGERLHEVFSSRLLQRDMQALLLSATRWFLEHPLLLALAGAGTVLVEALYPLALLSRRARVLLVPGAFGLQVGIDLFMGIRFYTFMVANVFWIPWERFLPDRTATRSSTI